MRTNFLLRGVGCVLLLAGGWAEAADWPQWLGPTRNGVSPEAVAPWKGSPKVVWRRKVAPAFSSMGLDPRKQNLSNVGRPIRLVDPSARPIREILLTA